MKTLTKTFRNVGPDDRARAAPVQGERATFVVVASQRTAAARCRRSSATTACSRSSSEKDTVELTDDHVPVDQLLAPVYGDSLEAHDEASAGE